jgi:hypothetical protein
MIKTIEAKTEKQPKLLFKSEAELLVLNVPLSTILSKRRQIKNAGSYLKLEQHHTNAIIQKYIYCRKGTKDLYRPID